jgi:hypothetical protein
MHVLLYQISRRPADSFFSEVGYAWRLIYSVFRIHIFNLGFNHSYSRHIRDHITPKPDELLSDKSKQRTPSDDQKLSLK